MPNANARVAKLAHSLAPRRLPGRAARPRLLDRACWLWGCYRGRFLDRGFVVFRGFALRRGRVTGRAGRAEELPDAAGWP